MISLFIFCLFIISYFLRLPARIPALAEIRFDFILGVSSLLCIFLSKHPDRLRLSDRGSRYLLIFCLYIIISLPLVTWPGSVIRFHFEEWAKAAMFFILTVASIRSVYQLKLVMAVFLSCQAVRVVEPLLLHLFTGYWGDVAYSHVGGVMSSLDRLSGAPYDVVNPNQLAWVIVNTVPFFFYLLWQGKTVFKILAFISALPFIYCLMLTGSRSGLLSLIVTILGIVYFSKRSARNLVVACLIAIPFGIYAFAFLDFDMQTRYLSLFDSSLPGADTAKGRIDGLVRELGSISNNPLFGNGIGTSREANFNIIGGRAQITHNLYIEVLQEAGIIGFGIFVMFLVATFKSLINTRKLLKSQICSENDYWLFRLSTGVLVWMIMDLFYSFSCFGLRSWEWYFFGGIAAICQCLSKESVIIKLKKLNMPITLGYKNSNKNIFKEMFPRITGNYTGSNINTLFTRNKKFAIIRKKIKKYEKNA